MPSRDRSIFILILLVIAMPEANVTNSDALIFRLATQSDLVEIVRMLADDRLGANREHFSEPLLAGYVEAFASIDQDPNNEILVLQDREGTLLGFLQVTYIPNLTYQGRWRALIEGVRVRSENRSGGVGKALMGHAIERARARNCNLVQLTSDKTRTQALRFYESLGFNATHEGFKLFL